MNGHSFALSEYTNPTFGFSVNAFATSSIQSGVSRSSWSASRSISHSAREHALFFRYPIFFISSGNSNALILSSARTRAGIFAPLLHSMIRSRLLYLF